MPFEPHERSMKQIALDIALGSVPSLTNFLGGPNEDALKHLQLWAGNTLRSPVPTYLWGESASGKTHLLRAVGEALREQGAVSGWMDATLAEPPEFSDAWTAVILDDCNLYSAVQQQAAFNWFVNAINTPDGRPRWVLAAGNVPPADLPLRDDLRSRLGWGHVFALQVLHDSERRAVLRREADTRGVFLSDEVMDFMLSRFSRDLSSLMQLLDQLDRYALQTQRAITIPLIKSMLDNA
jgi:DnaA-homolog protein